MSKIKKEVKREKKIKELTTRQLKQRIRTKTKEVNKRIDEYRKKGKENPAMEKMITRLYKASGQKKTNKLAANVSYKRKNELEYQYRTLNQFLQFDNESDTAQRESNDKIMQQYLSFKSNLANRGVDLTFDEYKDMADQLGSIGADALGTFNYMGALEEYSKQIKTGKEVNLVDIYNKSKKAMDAAKANNKIWTTRDTEEFIINSIRTGIF